MRARAVLVALMLLTAPTMTALSAQTSDESMYLRRLVQQFDQTARVLEQIKRGIIRLNLQVPLLQNRIGRLEQSVAVVTDNMDDLRNRLENIESLQTRQGQSSQSRNNFWSQVVAGVLIPLLLAAVYGGWRFVLWYQKQNPSE